MLRRDFLRRTSLALAGGLVVGDAALELFARLTHTRKSFPSAAIVPRWTGRAVYFDTPTFSSAMIPEGGYEPIAIIPASAKWDGPNTVDWQAFGLDAKAMEAACLGVGQREGFVESIYAVPEVRIHRVFFTLPHTGGTRT